MKQILLLILIIFVVQKNVHCQYSTTSKKAIQIFNEAKDAYAYSDFNRALNLLYSALQNDSSFVEAHLMMADIYTQNNQPELSIKSYTKALKINPYIYTMVYYSRANVEISIGDYENALKDYEKFATYTQYQKKYGVIVDKKIATCKFGIQATQHPVPFNPVNLGANVNSEFSEYWPCLTADGRTLIFTRLVTKDESNHNVRPQEDFFISEKVDSVWTKAKNMGNPINTSGNEGASSISADGNMMVYTSCACADGVQKCCDIYITYKSGDSWTTPIKLPPPVNTDAWESQPSLSSDGRTLYFSSNRKGGHGGYDIWMSTQNDDMTWNEPINLGDSINTSGDEQAPFIHADNKTLYFTSSGWTGLGGNDLFMSRRIADTSWTTPKNLGYPINTWKDEMGLIVNAEGNRAMFASSRAGGFGKHDIYQFELPQDLRPTKSIYITGNVFDAETLDKLEANFELIDLETQKIIVKSKSDKNDGKFLLCIPINKNYALNVSKKGYLFYSDNFSLKDSLSSKKSYQIDVPLSQIKTGKICVLRNIFFETDLFNLKPESNAELNKLVDFLKFNPSVKIEIRGHTDNVGKAEHNKTLSNNRAKVVYEYLIAKQISQERLKFAGFGATLPVATNDTEAGRAQNRRTEFRIIE